MDKQHLVTTVFTALLLALTTASVSAAGHVFQRADVVKTKMVYEGHWGDWSRWHYCPGNQNRANSAIGFNVKYEAMTDGGDSTAVNAISLICANGERVTPSHGHWGEWQSNDISCLENGSFLTGLGVTSMGRQGSGQGAEDDVSVYQVTGNCGLDARIENNAEGPYLASVGPSKLCKRRNLVVGESGRGQCAEFYSFTGHAEQFDNESTAVSQGYPVCGLRVRVEANQGSGDDTSLNGLEIAFCKEKSYPPSAWPAALDGPSILPFARFNASVQSGHSHQCIDGTAATSGGNVIQYPCHGGENQTIQFQPVDGDYPYYFMRFKHAHECLEVPDGNSDNGVSLIHAPCNGWNKQRFQIESVGGDLFKITGKVTRKVLDVKGISLDPDADIQQWEYVGGPNQKWRFTMQ